MKLLNRAILIYSLSTLLSFILIGTILYNSIRHIVLKQVSEALLTEKKIIQEQLEYTDTVPDFSDTFNHQIEVTIFKHRLKTSQEFIDTLLYDTITKAPTEYRFLKFTSSTADNRGYIIKTSQSIEEEKDLLYEILSIIAISFGVLSLILILVIYSVSRGLWDSFYKILFNIQQFDVKINREFVPVPNRISEFRELNKVLEKLTDKIKSDYMSLKEFSENASHEIQTPLAIIQGKIEQILQSDKINNDLATHLISISQSVNRISRINQILALISKIENNQYTETRLVNINRRISEIISQFHDFIESRQLEVKYETAETVEMQLNTDLIDTLLTNLISNAIKHNIDRGWIFVKLSKKELVIQNSGKDPHMNTNLLFQRFRKAEHYTDSPGLGLAIVKKITDLYAMKITYEYTDLIHTLRIIFH